MSEAAERFARWLVAMGWSTEEAARQLACSYSMAQSIRLGRRKPGRALAAAIEDRSRAWEGGPILSTDWDRGSVPQTGTDG